MRPCYFRFGVTGRLRARKITATIQSLKTPEAAEELSVPTPYTRHELLALEMSVASGRVSCPLCGGAMERRPVRPRADVSYVRDRLWLTCLSCDRHGVVDLPKTAHPEEDRE